MNALFFDLDDTLYNQLQPFQSAYNMVFSHVTNISILDLFKKSREYSDKVFALTESGEMPLDTMHRNRVIYAFNHFDYKIEDEEAMLFQKIYKEHQYKISLEPEMKNILNYLSGKDVQLYILTNGPSAHQRSKIEALDLFNWIPKSNIFISSEIGYAKPQREIFDYINSKTNTQGSTSYMIGDSFENDIMGAHLANWNSIWLNTKNRAKTVSHIHPQHEVTSYEELESVIRRII